ncbi:MAG: putative peptidoglycan glycosyltransferase FtsW [Clostridiales bacterium]|nr:putative peptidoglycan glycosyltransferase FtsW [Clostridiales bacterium]
MSRKRNLEVDYVTQRSSSQRYRDSQDTVHKKLHSYYDYSLLFLTLLLCCFGLVMIYSSSSYTAQIKYGDAGYFMKKQLVAVLLGVFAMVIVSMFDYHALIDKIPGIPVRLAWIAYLAAIFLQVLVLIIGKEVNGAKRWIYIGPVSLQPSEISKVVAIIFVSFLVSAKPKVLRDFQGFLAIVVFMFPLLFLIAKENLSTAIVLFAIIIGICFVASPKKGYYFVTAFVMAGFVALYVLFGDPFRIKRFKVWLDVENEPMGYQILQGLYAVASGKLFGTGLGESMQKLGFIPEAHNDMIFSVICEELGLFGACIVVLLFMLLIWRLFVIAINAPDMFGGLLCTGILVHVAVQVLINIAVVTNSIPSTGIPLPFVSYGGTSVAILLAEIGIALSVSNRIRYERH